MSEFRRGFESWCETVSVQFRTALGLLASATLPAGKLAVHLGVRVLDVSEGPRAFGRFAAAAYSDRSGKLVGHAGPLRE